MENKNTFVVASGDPNHRLLDRIVLLEIQKPFDLIPYYKSTYNKEILAEKKLKNPFSFPEKCQSLIWSGLLNEVRTHFEKLLMET